MNNIQLYRAVLRLYQHQIFFLVCFIIQRIKPVTSYLLAPCQRISKQNIIVPTDVSAPHLSTRASDVVGKVIKCFLLHCLVQQNAHWIPFRTEPRRLHILNFKQVLFHYLHIKVLQNLHSTYQPFIQKVLFVTSRAENIYLL